MSNCLFYAIYKYFTCGGHIVFRKSLHGKWSHMMWSQDLVTFYHYVPVNQPLKYPAIQKIMFKGVVKVNRVKS